MREIVVVGGGAAGLWAAEVASRLGSSVVVLEKTSRTGTKVLASGGSHCNLTTTLEAGQAAQHFRRRGGKFLRPALESLSPMDIRGRFETWGVPTTEAPLEKVFPASNRAKDVRDALESAAVRAGATIKLNSPVQAVKKTGKGWSVELGDGGQIACSKVILAPGGQSYPLTGTTGDGYAWLRSLDLPVVPPSPALVPLLSPAAWVHRLAGVSLQEAEVRLHDAKGRLIATRSRPILFTHRGVSGPGAMDVSTHLARAEPPLSLRVDLAPQVTREELRDLLIQAAGAPGEARLSRILSGTPKRLLLAVTAQAGVGDNPVVKSLDRASRHKLIEALKGLAIPLSGTEGYSKAEVTGGGLDLRAVNPRTMEVNTHPGLYVAGELLDLDGPIGGFSFLAAFATAELAGAAAAARP